MAKDAACLHFMTIDRVRMSAVAQLKGYSGESSLSDWMRVGSFRCKL